jgi:hypothetical protein
MRRFTGLRAWSARDWGNLVESTLLAIRVEAGLRLHPLPVLVSRLGRGTRRTAGPGSPGADECRRLARFAGMPYRHLPMPSSCLRESLVLYALLRRRGAAAELRIGVRKEGPALAAHAWVDHPGADAPDGRFGVLVPAAASRRPRDH